MQRNWQGTALAWLSMSLLLGGAWPARAQRRFVLQVPGADQVVVQRVVYKSEGNVSLRMDLYRPPSSQPEKKLPAVIFTNGVGLADLPDWEQYTGWGRAVAASGLIAINYQSRGFPAMADSEDLLAYVLSHGNELGIDTARLGLYACSANVMTGVPLALTQSRPYLRAAVFYYGTATGAQLNRQDLPILVVRAGLDDFGLNLELDRLVQRALAADLRLELINFREGHHGFEIIDDTDLSRDIVRRTLEFFKKHLDGSAQQVPAFLLTTSNFYTMMASGAEERAMALMKERIRTLRETKADSESLRVREMSERSLIATGDQLLALNQTNAAFEVFRLIAETHPGSALARLRLAEAYASRGETAAAVSQAREALRLVEQATQMRDADKQQVRERASALLARLKDSNP